jgi:hypothetical protein
VETKVTPDILAWGHEMISRYDIPTDEPAIELGSRRVNPDYHSFREFFTGSYLGVDQEEGLNVDYVSKIGELPIYDWAEQYSTVVCTEVLEHDLEFWRTISIAQELLRQGGYLLITTCGFGFPRHDFPVDYYRFSEEALRALLERFWFTVLTSTEMRRPDYGPTVAAVGYKA